MVFDCYLYLVMEILFVNGGQFFVSNVEVWNSIGMLFKGIKWMLCNDVLLLFNFKLLWYKYLWIGEFVVSIVYYCCNIIEIMCMVIEVCKYLFVMVECEQIDFDLQKCGILYVYYDKVSFVVVGKVNVLFVVGGFECYVVSFEDIVVIELILWGNYYGGYFIEFDVIGDIYKFMCGFVQVCEKCGVCFM